MTVSGRRVEPGDLVGPQLRRRPRRDRIRDGGLAAVAQGDQFSVGVAAHPHGPVAERGQRVERLDRLRAGREVAGEHDAVGRPDRRLGEHRFQRRQHAMDVGQHRDPHPYTLDATGTTRKHVHRKLIDTIVS